MTAERCYPVSREYLLNVVNDIIELQKAQNITSDTSQGKIGFSVQMYGFHHQYDFAIRKEDGRCHVALTTDGDTAQDQKRLGRMFSLLENLMD